eukprot:49361-Rhodomonas_salina.3
MSKYKIEAQKVTDAGKTREEKLKIECEVRVVQSVCVCLRHLQRVGQKPWSTPNGERDMESEQLKVQHEKAQQEHERAKHEHEQAMERMAELEADNNALVANAPVLLRSPRSLFLLSSHLLAGTERARAALR